MGRPMIRLEARHEPEQWASSPDIATDEGAAPTVSRCPWRRYGLILLALGILTAGGWWLYQQFTHVFVTDARIAADIVAMSSRVPGWVTAMEVTEGDAVAKGRVLARIDDRESRLRVQALDAQLAGIARRRTEIEARIALTNHQTQNRIAAERAAVRAADADLAQAEAQRDLARQDNARAERLVPRGMLPEERLDRTRAALETAPRGARPSLDEIRSRIGEFTSADDGTGEAAAGEGRRARRGRRRA